MTRDDMTNQDIVDLIEMELIGIISIGLREKVLDAVHDVLSDHRSDPVSE